MKKGFMPILVIQGIRRAKASLCGCLLCTKYNNEVRRMVTISGANLNKIDQTENSPSIQGNPYAQNTNKSGKIDFQGVIVSGSQVNQSKLDQNTYKSLLQETDRVKEQIMAGATQAKDNLKALFNRLSGADAVAIDKDGIDLNEISTKDMVNIVDRIKIELAAHSDGAVVPGASVDRDKVMEVVGDAGLANRIVGKMQEGDVPVTEDNVEQVEGVLSKTQQITALSEGTKNFLVSNQMPPTVDNLYKAQYMQQGMNQKAADTLSEEEWESIRPQVEKIITDAGLEINEQNLGNAKTFIQQQIPLTPENLQYKEQLDSLDISQVRNSDEFLEKVVEQLAIGGDVFDTEFTNEPGVITQVAKTIQTVNDADYSHVETVTKKGIEVTVEQLKDAVAESNESKTQANETIDVAKDTDTTKDMDEDVERNYRLLQEVRILMTAQAGLFLAKQGTNLLTTPLYELDQQLKLWDQNHIKDTYVNLTNQKNSTVQNAQQLTEQTEAYQTIFQVRKALFEINKAPDVTIGTVLAKTEAGKKMTISALSQTGSSLRKQYERAGQTYEAVGTEVRTDLGDSIRKAVKASTEDLLTEIGLENTKANRDAVRILGYNGMEINKQYVNQIKEIHATLNHLVDQMKPETVLQMIRDNVNPMTEDINDLSAYLTAQNDKLDKSDEKEAKYSQFLYKLDRTNGISKEERAQFIGIYKMVNLFTKDAGEAIGALVKQNADLTMSNLCTAYNSRRVAGMDVSIDENTGFAEVTGTVDYFNNLFTRAGKVMTPLTMRNVNQQQNILDRSIENFCESCEETYDAKEEEAYYEMSLKEMRSLANADESVIKELSQNNQQVTVHNIQAMEQIMSTNVFTGIFKQASNGRDTDKKVGEFLDQVGNKDKLSKEYDDLSDAVSKQLTDTIENDDTADHDQIEDLRLMNQEIGIIKNLSIRHDYKIPFVTEDGIGTINLTLVSDEDEKGSISINFKNEALGEVSVEAKVHGSELNLYGLTDKEGSALEQRLGEVSEKLQADYDLSKVHYQCGNVSEIHRITYSNAANSVATDQLYSMARDIIKGLVS
jgi:DNA-binding winged helix-turn-helix (wHTH) protein